MVKYDFHCHSTASDGALSPREVVLRAHQQGVTHLALTDHDTVNGLAQAQQVADEIGLTLINGIEISTLYHGHNLHIVGLGINPAHPLLQAGLQQQQQLRAERAKKIALKLEKKRIAGAYQAVQAMAGVDGMITRSHFAEFLVAQGLVKTAQEAFDYYLAQGKAAYVATVWLDMAAAVQQITAAGGVAVLAHPLRYPLTARWMNRVLVAFKDAGGEAIEVVTGRSNADEVARAQVWAQKYGLWASVGSDFHTPDYPWVEVGRLLPLPPQCSGVWERLG